MAANPYALNNLGVIHLQRAEHEAARLCFHRVLKFVQTTIRQENREDDISAYSSSMRIVSVRLDAQELLSTFPDDRCESNRFVSFLTGPIIMYQKAFIIVGDESSNDGTTQAEAKVVACTLFNIALMAHRRARNPDHPQKSNQAKLLAHAGHLYKMAQAILVRDSSNALLLCAIWNNLAHVHANFYTQGEHLQECNDQLAYAFALARADASLSQEDYAFFASGTVLNRLYAFRFAPAA